MRPRCAAVFLLLAAASFAGEPLPRGAVARLGSPHFRFPRSPDALALSPDGKTLVSFLRGSATIEFRDVASRTAHAPLPLAGQLPPDPEEVHLAFSADGTTLAVGHQARVRGIDQKADLVLIVDAATRRSRSIVKINGHLGVLTLSPDGKRLAVVSRMWDAQLYETSTGKAITSLGPLRELLPPCFSPDGSVVAVVDRKVPRNILILDAASGKERARIPVGLDTLLGLAISPDCKVLATAFRGYTLRTWDVASGKPLQKFDRGSVSTGQLTFSPDGKDILADIGDGVLARIEAATLKEKLRFQEGHRPFDHVCFSAGGKLAAFSYRDGPHTVRFVDMGTSKEVFREPGHLAEVECLSFSPDGKLLATAARHRGDPVIRLWQPRTGKLVREWDDHEHGVAGIAFVDGGHLASVGMRSDREVRFWDVTTGKETRRLDHDVNEVLRLFTSDDRNVIAVTGHDYARRGRVLVWDRTGKVRLSLPREGELINSPPLGGLSPDGSLLATALDEVALWKTHMPGDPRLLPASQGAFDTLLFSSDSWLVLVGRKKGPLSLYELRTGEEVLTFDARQASRGASALSPDGCLLAVAESGGAIRLYSLLDGKPAGEFPGHGSGEVRSLAFSPDSALLASGGTDATVLLWDVSTLNRKPTALLTPDQLRKCWHDLADPKPATAYRAGCLLARCPTTPVYLDIVLPPVSNERLNYIARLIADLDARRFSVRQKAMEELRKEGELALPALRRALEGGPTLEVRRRVEELLDRHQDSPSPESLRELRALLVLQRLGTPEARKMLQKLADGHPDAPLSIAAREALARMRPIEKRKAASGVKRGRHAPATH